jgi:Icc-related predicted phosphoesterase
MSAAKANGGMTDANGLMKVAALGDLHVREDGSTSFRDLFGEISREADVMVLAGDLTDLGKPKEAELLAQDLKACSIPVIGVLGNHDYECGQPEEVAKILHSAGMTVLGEQAVIIHDVGFAGVKGFLGGFGRGELGAFGEPAIKSFVDAALEEARRLENALRSLKTERSVAVLHYAPVVDTVEGEPLEIYPFLGCSRLADAVDRFDHVAAVVHGHAHRGRHRGRTPRGIPVYNCAMMVTEAELSKPYALIEV